VSTQGIGEALTQRRGKESYMAEIKKEAVPCPQPDCGGIAKGEVQYSNGGGSQDERIVRWIMDCQTCGYWGPNRAA
jgi:hypothetical protein